MEPCRRGTVLETDPLDMIWGMGSFNLLQRTSHPKPSPPPEYPIHTRSQHLQTLLAMSLAAIAKGPREGGGRAFGVLANPSRPPNPPTHITSAKIFLQKKVKSTKDSEI